MAAHESLIQPLFSIHSSNNTPLFGLSVRILKELPCGLYEHHRHIPKCAHLNNGLPTELPLGRTGVHNPRRGAQGEALVLLELVTAAIGPIALEWSTRSAPRVRCLVKFGSLAVRAIGQHSEGLKCWDISAAAGIIPNIDLLGASRAIFARECSDLEGEGSGAKGKKSES